MRVKSKIVPTPGTLIQYLLKQVKPKLTSKHVGGVPKYEVGTTTSKQVDKMYDEWEGSFERISPSNKLILDAEKEIDTTLRGFASKDLSTFAEKI